MWSLINYLTYVMTPKTTLDVVFSTVCMLILVCAVCYLAFATVRTRIPKKVRTKKIQYASLYEEEQLPTIEMRAREGEGS